MSTRETIQIINLVLSLAAIIPSYILLKDLVEERGLLGRKDSLLNWGLVLIFLAILIMAIGNALVSILAVFKVGLIAHKFSPYGRLFASTGFSVASWLIYFVNKELKKE